MKIVNEKDSINTYNYIPTGKKYIFYKKLEKNIGGGIENVVLNTLRTNVLDVVLHNLSFSGGRKNWDLLFFLHCFCVKHQCAKCFSHVLIISKP